jgi:hypothetical protein
MREMPPETGSFPVVLVTASDLATRSPGICIIPDGQHATTQGRLPHGLANDLWLPCRKCLQPIQHRVGRSLRRVDMSGCDLDEATQGVGWEPSK